MAITNYTTLKAAVASWLGRSDLTSVIPDFITLAEADIRRNLRTEATVAELTLQASLVDEENEYKALLSPTMELRSLRYKGATRKYALTQVTVAALADLRRPGTGLPQYFAVADGNLMLDVGPSSDLTMEVVYYDNLVALSDAAPTNNTLTNHPDIYLFGALKEAEPYLEHDERVPLWEAKYNKAVTDANNARERAEHGAAPLARRLPVVFG